MSLASRASWRGKECETGIYETEEHRENEAFVVRIGAKVLGVGEIGG